MLDPFNEPILDPIETEPVAPLEDLVQDPVKTGPGVPAEDSILDPIKTKPIGPLEDLVQDQGPICYSDTVDTTIGHEPPHKDNLQRIHYFDQFVEGEVGRGRGSLLDQETPHNYGSTHSKKHEEVDIAMGFGDPEVFKAHIVVNDPINDPMATEEIQIEDLGW